MAADQRIQDCLKLDAEQAARRFFDASPDDKAVKEMFEALLDAGEYEKLAEMIFYGSIVRQQSERDYIARSEMKSLDETYFDAFMLLAERAGVDKAKLYPMLAATATASGTLGKWRRPVENRILRLAYKDFDKAEALVYAYDPDCALYRVLLAADADKATEAIIGRLLFEKGGGKTALRRFLKYTASFVPASRRPSNPQSSTLYRCCLTSIAMICPVSAAINTTKSCKSARVLQGIRWRSR